MTTTLEPQFLRAVILMGDFKPGEMRRVKGAALAIARTGIEFTATDLPREVTNGSIHIAGAALGALVSEGLLRVVDRRKSPDPAAKGRKLNVFQIGHGKSGAVRAWFTAQNLTPPEYSDGQPQMNLIAV